MMDGNVSVIYAKWLRSLRCRSGIEYISIPQSLSFEVKIDHKADKMTLKNETKTEDTSF